VPTLLEIEGFRFYFFSLEHEPPHVHVRRGHGKARFLLSPVELVKSRGFTRAELRRSHDLTEEHAASFLQRWNEYFHR
jgi:hypothetical protein